MDTSRYKEALEKLNKAQRRAVETIEGPVIVIAGPGTGKTQVLTTRIAHIIHETDTPPSGILALTFTDAGAQAMRKRLKELIGKAAYSVEIATFHSFANSVVEDYPDSFPRLIGARQMDALEQLEMLEAILVEEDLELLKPHGDPLYYLKPISKSIQDIKREGHTPESFKKLLEKQVADFESIEDLRHTKGKYEGEMKGKYRTIEQKIRKNFELLSVFEAYESRKALSRVFDYDDAILELLQALKSDEDLLLTLQERYLYFLVDEHQDSNGAQNKIIDLLSHFHEEPNLFIVGDDKQAIYRFQGASLENFLFFTKRYPGAEKIELTENYRSHQNILDVAHNLIQNNPTLSTERLVQRAERVDITPRLIEVRSEAEEAQFVAREAQRILEENPDESIAILYRQNQDADTIELALEQRGVDYTKLSGTRKDLHPFTEQFLTLLSIAHEPTEELLSLALFFEAFSLDPQALVSLFERARRKGISIKEESSSDPKIEAAVSVLLRLQKTAVNRHFFELFEEALHSTGLINSIVKTEKAQEALSEIEKLYNLARKLEIRDGRVTLESFLSHIERARKQNLLKLGKQAGRSSNVVLSTVHGVKGMEYDTVFVVGLENKRWGGKKKREYFYLPEFKGLSVGEEGEAEEDERRLFYVALTRARTRLILSVPEIDSEGKEYVPSRFIDELGEGLKTERVEIEGSPLREPSVKQTHPLLDPDYIETLFLSRSLNATAVNKYLKCPWEYFFLTLLKLPHTPGASAQYGTAVHATLQTFFDKRTSDIDLSAEEVVALLEEHLLASRMPESEKSRFLKKGSSDLVGYIENYKDHLPRSVETEHSIKNVELLVDGHELRLSGKLDLVERTEGGLIVTDFKTGKPKSRNEIEGKTKSGTGDYKRQLVFYSLLLEGVGEKMKEGVIDFIEPNERGKYKQERFTVSEEEREALVTVIKEMTQDILSLEFTEKGCNQKTCDWCRLSESLMGQNS